MGLMNKLKNILFEEEEVDIPVIEKKEKKQPQVEEEPIETLEPTKPAYSSFYDDLEPVVKKEETLEEKNVNVKPQTQSVSEREIFKSEKTFNFPAFDEEEFESLRPAPRPTNVMEYERRSAKKEKEEYKRYEAPSLKKEEKTKFKPSPIISPVYGILDKNYTPDEITSRTTPASSRKLDVDSVRKKAFGIELPKEEIIEKEDEDAKVLEENLDKARTIDELLKDSSDEIIDVINDLDEEEVTPEVEQDDLDDMIESEDFPTREEKHEEKVEEKKEHHDVSVEDTMESDLFDLIDSMYENREDGE